MSRKTLLLIAVVAILIIGFAVLYVFRPEGTSVKSKKVDIHISADNLVQAFEMDESEANKVYIDKIILVSGTIESITDGPAAIIVTLKNPEAISGVSCKFDPSSVNKEALVAGNQVRIKGICNGYTLDVVLSKCSLEE